MKHRRWSYDIATRLFKCRICGRTTPLKEDLVICPKHCEIQEVKQVSKAGLERNKKLREAQTNLEF